MQKTTITFLHGHKKWRPYQEGDEGSENITASVTRLGDRHFLIEADQYYSSGGVLKLEITQHFDRAMNTFAALLMEDNTQEDEDCFRAAGWNQTQEPG